MKITSITPGHSQAAGLNPLTGSAKRLPKAIGRLIARNGDRLVLRLVEGKLFSFQLHFFTEDDHPVGYIEMLSGGGHLNYIYVDPAYRGRHYAEAFMDALLKGFIDKRFRSSGLGYLKTYLRNPLIVGLFEARGFKLIDYTAERTRLEVIIGQDKGVKKISIFVSDPERRESFRDFCQQADNPDWHIFNVVDEPIPGRAITIFADYSLDNREKLMAHLSSAPTQVEYY